MNPTMRKYRDNEDYWRIRPFLREIFLLNGRREVTWQVAEWDYWRWPEVESWGGGPIESCFLIWEMPDGQIVAVVNGRGPGDAHFQVHPAFHTPPLEAEMLDAAEAHLAKTNENGQQTLDVWIDGGNVVRRDMLQRRGYARSDEVLHKHRISLSEPIRDVSIPDGFTLRPLGDVDELPARSWFSWKAFQPDEPEENYEKLGWEWYLDIQRCPLYRRDLDLVTIAPNGDIASFTTVWFDDVTRSAYFEPVGTYTPYQRRGLAKAVMVEGLRRVKRLGATMAFVGGFSPEADALYTSVMGPEYTRSERWVKEL